ncbi:hypothetical protein BPOR_0314g00010 [Botrytis porri]|uniref:Uncharacterized protein n=1 Tax=Botrytis porri TaxID=87229 RepID=A0A4Z1KLT0_9HELO|nr:hypothetical protein BPOR_0314g00010 [Botrytis porri]
MALSNTGLACTTSPGEVLHLIFQQFDGGRLIREARSPDGGSVWSFQDLFVAEDADFDSSPMTYKKLMGKVEHLERSTPIWTNVKVPNDI